MVKFVWNFQIFLQITEYNFIFQKFLGTSRFWSYKEVFLRLTSNTRISRLLEISARQPRAIFCYLPNFLINDCFGWYELMKNSMFYILKYHLQRDSVKKIARG